MQSCLLPGKGKNTIIFNLKNQPKKETFKPNLISINISNDVVTINGSGFSKVTEVKIQGSGVDVGFNVDSLTDSKIIASAKSALSLLVGSTLNLIISSAEASTTFPITFTLQDGSVTNTKLHSMGAQPGEVLEFNGTNWAPASIASPMRFIGMWDASSGSPTAGAYSIGDYFIVSGAGSYGTDNYVVGDWAVYDGADWNRVFTDTGTKLSKTGGTLTGDLILDTQANFKGGANYVTLKASAGLASDITLTLPTTVGTNGQVLTTNGSGVMSWQTVASGGGSSGAVNSVNSQTGTVTLTTTDIAEGANQYFTTARALSAVTASLATKQSADTTLTSLAAYNTNGILVQTAADTFTGRTLTGTANRLTVTDGNGVAGDPTVDISTSLLPSPSAGNANQFLMATGANSASWTTPPFISNSGETVNSGTFDFSGGSAVVRVADPTLLTDVANKQYVDAAIAGVSTASGSWTASGADVYRLSGNVGIGTTAPDSLLSLNGNTNTQLPGSNSTGTILHLTGADNTKTRILVDAFGSGVWPALTLRLARGTGPTPTAIQNGDRIAQIAFQGYGTSTYAAGPGLSGFATENWTDSARGSALIFQTVTNGVASQGEKMRIDQNGHVGIGTASPTSKLDVNGEIRTRGSSNGYVGFQAAADTSSQTYTWPVSAGVNGQVLTTTGTGALTWTTFTGGGTGAVYSVNSQTGTVTLTTTDIGEGSNLYFSDARAQSALTASLATKQDLNSNLTALSSYNTNGIFVQTASNTFTGRSIANTANRTTVTNGDGVAGNPTIDINTSLLPSPVAGNTNQFLMASGANTATWTTPNYISKSGDTVSSGTIAIDAGAFLTVPTPVNPSDATNKTYVDSAMVSASTASNSWTASGTNIYRASGNVGIGTNAPTAQFHIVGTASVSSSTLPNVLTITGARNTGTGAGAGISLVTGIDVNSHTGGSLLLGGGGWGGGGAVTLAAGINGGGGPSAVTITGSGGSGGGNQDGGAININAGNATANYTGGNLNLTGGGSGVSGTAGHVYINGGAAGAGGINGNVILANSRGSVGIGTTAPTASLTVRGEMRALGSSAGYVGFQAAANSASTTYTWPTTTGTSGYVLSTDGSGVLSWITTQGADSTLTALAAYNTDGIMVQTAADTFVGRSIANTANRTVVTNGDGVSGNPTIDINTSLLPSPIAGNIGQFFKASGANTATWTALASSDVTGALGFTPINKAGDTISGTLTFTSGNFTIGQSAFLIVPNPVLSTDAVNKGYVDGFGQWLKNGSDIYRSSGNVGIGIASPNSALQVMATTSTVATAGEEYAAYFSKTYSVADTNIKQGLRVNVVASNTSGVVAELASILSIPTSAGSGGTVTHQTAYWARADVSSGSSVTNARGFWMHDSAGVGSPTNQYGLYVDTLTKGTSSNYAVYTAGTTPSYFGGNLLLGATSASRTLHISSTTPGAGGIKVVSGNVTSGDVATLEMIGKRSDTNPSGAFAGTVALAHNYTSGAVTSGMMLGRIIFGGNQTDGTEANILYSSSVAAVAEGTFANSASMSSGLAFYTGSTGVTTSSTTAAAGTERMRINSSGYVGIGNTSPSALLHIGAASSPNSLRAGTGLILGTFGGPGADNGMNITTSPTGATGFIDFGIASATSTKGSIQYNTATDYMSFYTNSLERLRMDSSGNVGIGASSPTASLTVAGTASISGQTFFGGDVGIGTATPGYTLDVNGSIAAVGALQAHSDRALKKNIVNVDHAIDKLMQINGVYFDWRKNEFPKIKFEGGRQIGVVAQDVEKVFPEAVAKNKDGIRSVAYTMLIGPIIEAIKTLAKDVKALVARMFKLEEKTSENERAIASVKEENLKIKKENMKFKDENAAIKVYLCKKDPTAPFCKKVGDVQK